MGRKQMSRFSFLLNFSSIVESILGFVSIEKIYFQIFVSRVCKKHVATVAR